MKSLRQQKGMTLADRIARQKAIEKSIIDMQESYEKAKIRVMWFMITALADAEGINLSKDQIVTVFDELKHTSEQYDQLVQENDVEDADSFLLRRVNKILEVSDEEGILHQKPQGFY